jgi:hypothetical protein
MNFNFQPPSIFVFFTEVVRYLKIYQHTKSFIPDPFTTAVWRWPAETFSREAGETWQGIGR